MKRLIDFQFLAWFLACACMGCLLRSKPLTVSLAEEMALLGVILGGLWHIPAVRRKTSSWRFAERCLLAIVIAVFAVGQFADRGQSTFPMVTWDMYTEADPDTKSFPVVRLFAVAPEGEWQLHEDSVLRGLRGGLGRRIENLMNLWETADPVSREKYAKRVNRMLTLFGNRYHAQHPGVSLDAIEARIFHYEIDWQTRTWEQRSGAVWNTPLAAESEK